MAAEIPRETLVKLINKLQKRLAVVEPKYNGNETQGGALDLDRVAVEHTRSTEGCICFCTELLAAYEALVAETEQAKATSSPSKFMGDLLVRDHSLSCGVLTSQPDTCASI